MIFKSILKKWKIRSLNKQVFEYIFWSRYHPLQVYYILILLKVLLFYDLENLIVDTYDSYVTSLTLLIPKALELFCLLK